MRFLRTLRERWLSLLGGTVMFGAAVVVSASPVLGFADRWQHQRHINAHAYKARYGHWSMLDMPASVRVNAVHAALLYTGKVLIIAGSGNNQGNFDAGRFESIIWDPATETFNKIRTPADMFCGGHAFLPDGKLLIAGGTARYEVLKGNFKAAAGVMTVRNADPRGAVTLPKGTVFEDDGGRLYRAVTAATVPAAEPALGHGAGRIAAMAGSAKLWVRAVRDGSESVVQGPIPTTFRMPALAPEQTAKLSAEATEIGLENQDYWGIKKSYVFDPATERYEPVSDLTLARWYPTLVSLKGGKVLAVSGLDGFGKMIQGHVEQYDPATRMWSPEPKLQRTFPTYPALFLLPSGNLFYSGANAGYGLQSVGRTPGIWDVGSNQFDVVPGLRDPEDTETAGSVLLPPAQDQRYAMVGGATPPGASTSATSRIDVVDLREAQPHWHPAGDLPQPTRYPNLVVTPDDKVIITGGSREYRGKDDSDILECHLYDPRTERLSPLAAPTVGRDYHSEALLLPDGRVVTLGSNPIDGIKGDHTPNYFEQRIEVYTPPYLYHGARPALQDGPRLVARGGIATFRTTDPEAIATARLIRPSAVTHVTNVEQRSIALSIHRSAGVIELGVPGEEGLVPPGWYMLFVADRQGTPSVAHWIRVQ